MAIVTKLPNVRYLSSFSGTSGAVIISARKALLATDFRYKEQAEKQISGYDIKIYETSFDAFLSSISKRLKGNTIGFESNHVSYEQFEKWSSSIDARWVPLDCLVENLRMVKDSQELNKIRKAAQIVDNAFSHILEFIKPGVSERAIAIELEYSIRKQGAERSAFELIVASGRRSAMPHATNSPFKIQAKSFLMIDMGAVYHGYCSDMTRTVFLGKAKDEEVKLYEAVSAAQISALEKIESGKKASEIDKEARNFLKKTGLDVFFGHNLGHGVGLEIHELPVLGPGSKAVLEPGMVFTVEPGIYMFNKKGIRIEDTIALKKDGIHILTRSPKELIEL